MRPFQPAMDTDQLIWDLEPREGSNNTFNFLTNEKFKNYKILYIEK